MNLLIINDEILTADMLRDEVAWELYGITQVSAVYDAQEAKKVMKDTVVDIALCDIEMPGENGIELLRWMRREKPEIECIFLTCHANFEYAQEAVKLGCQDYILIPSRYEEIGSAVHKVVERIQSKRDAVLLQSYGEHWLQIQKQAAVREAPEKKSPKAVVGETVTYIMENLGDAQLSVKAIAERFYLNPIYLNRIFKKEQGLSISQFMIQERMHMAHELLKDQTITAAMVAEQVGYPNYPYFSAVFKQVYGCSPSQYKESLL